MSAQLKGDLSTPDLTQGRIIESSQLILGATWLDSHVNCVTADMPIFPHEPHQR